MEKQLSLLNISESLTSESPVSEPQNVLDIKQTLNILEDIKQTQQLILTRLLNIENMFSKNNTVLIKQHNTDDSDSNSEEEQPPIIKKQATLGSQDRKKTELYIDNYTDKSIVVRGDTKTHKDKLKELGCKWNANLKGGGGWITSKANETKIREYVDNI